MKEWKLSFRLYQGVWRRASSKQAQAGESSGKLELLFCVYLRSWVSTKNHRTGHCRLFFVFLELPRFINSCGKCPVCLVWKVIINFDPIAFHFFFFIFWCVVSVLCSDFLDFSGLCVWRSNIGILTLSANSKSFEAPKSSFPTGGNEGKVLKDIR